jgi:MSHA biogenesis protein MshI
MRWPGQRATSGDPLVISWSGKTFAFVRARQRADGLHELLKFGLERQGADSMEDFVRRLQALGLKDMAAQAMLRPGQYQVLQIDAPAVPPEELRSAARYQIREMIDTHLDDITLDVMRVGDGQQKGAGHLFVVAATNAVVREVRDLCDAMPWTLPVVDIQETAQRNLQCALAAVDGHADRATAALVLIDGQQAVLTISAREELFYTRHFDLPEGFLAHSWGQGDNAGATADQAYSPVDEYVPDYSVGGVSYGNDYSGAGVGTAADGAGDDGPAQRLLVEVQRSLDVWDRSWSSMPLQCLRVFAGERSDELARWLATQLGQTVLPMEVGALFPGFENGSAEAQAQCLPLLGVLMRTLSRKL